MNKSFKKLFPYALRYRRNFILGLGCVVMTTAVTLLGPWVLKYAIDDLLGSVTRERLAFYALVLPVIAVIGGVFRFLMRHLIVGASREIECDLRNDFFAHLKRQPLSYFQKNRTGDLMSRATNDLNAVRMMIGPAIMYMSTTAIVFIVAIVMMIFIDPWLTALALIPLPFVSITVKYFGAAIHHRFERIQERLSNLSVVVQESLSGIRVVKAYGQEQSEFVRFVRANQQYLEQNKSLILLQAFFHPSMTLLLGFGALILLWLGAREVIHGRITVGDFVAFNGYLVLLTWPMIAFGWVTNLFQRGMASWERILEVLETVPSIDDRNASKIDHSTKWRGNIEFRNLSFAYGDFDVINRISVGISSGQTVAIIGHTGSGKSTLISMLPRIFDPPHGTVFIDGVDVKEIPLEILRGLIGFVQQEPFLFSTKVNENIAFGTTYGQDKKVLSRISSVEWAAGVARLDKDADVFPEGYDTVVGERGITLSGGQKQRVALARALITDPKILILDDAFSAVDTYTEEEMLVGLRKVMSDRTTIIVSHRISTIRNADQILVMENGQIVECGQHDELVKLDGIYAVLHRKQLLEKELNES